MTYGEIKEIGKEIERLSVLKAVYEGQEDEASVIAVDAMINKLQITRTKEINKLPVNTLEGGCLYLRIVKNKSWQAIAMSVGGKNTANGIRMKCDRFKW